jgi:hypothetical protein
MLPKYSAHGPTQPMHHGSQVQTYVRLVWYTGCPRRETASSVCTFPIHYTGPSGPRPVSLLRRPLLPVTSSSFTAPEVHSRSWRRHAREFEVKPLSSREKPQPTGSAEATLVGRDLFTFAGKWPWQWESTPIFRLCTAASPRCARRLAAVGQAQECSTETINVSSWWR